MDPTWDWLTLQFCMENHVVSNGCRTRLVSCSRFNHPLLQRCEARKNARSGSSQAHTGRQGQRGGCDVDKPAPWCWYIYVIWVCLKIGYIPNNSHLIGIMIINHWVIGYTIFRHTHLPT